MWKLSNVIAVLFFGTVFLQGQNLLPPIYNYTLLDYNGGSKNWGVTVNTMGELFVANNKGLLHYNGEEWRLNKLPNNTIIRSVLAVQDKIYTGSYEEFGYWKKNKKGILEYYSLTHLIENHEFTSEEFWTILHIKETIFFISFSAIYTYEKNKITVVNPPQVITDIIEYMGRIYLATAREGLFELKGNMIEPLEEQEPLLNKIMNGMAVVDGELLIATKLNGCFIYDGKDIKSWKSKLNKDLKSHQLTKVLNLTNGKLAFGTVKNGVYLYDRKNGTSQIINKEGGLQNNTVLSMSIYENQLWLGLDNGIARIKLNNPITYYTDHSGSLGTVYDMAFYKDKVYLGSNTGVFYFDSNGLNFVNGSQGHVWDLEIIDDALLCGHNTGTYLVKQSSVEKISKRSGGYRIVKIPERRNTYMQGTYLGLATYHKEVDGNWKTNKVAGINFPIKQLCFENPRTLWVAHPYKGFYRVHLNGDYTKVTQIQKYNDGAVQSNYNVKIYKIKNQIILNSEGIWFKYDTILDEIVPFPEFHSFNNHELLCYEDDYYWFTGIEGSKDIIRTNLKRDSLLIADLPLRKRLIPDSQMIIKTNDSISFITLADGFAKLNVTKLKRQLNGYKLPVPEFTFIKDKSNSSMPTDSEPLLFSFKKSRILQIGFATPRLIQPRYHYTLSGPEQHSGHVEGGTVTFQNLSKGSYMFNISTVGIDNTTSDVRTLAFTISPPWFLSNGMLILYLGLGFIVIIAVRWYNREKLKRKQLELTIRMKQEQDKRMSELENEKLAKEVKRKQNELASTTLNMAKKNEMILELKNMLILNKEKFSNSQRYRSFIKKLNNSIQNTEDWKRFEINFKELHEDFFERLLKEYPTLTPKDLKLCAYLKMNLSTKEIAPLMAISIRGVEIHRYRLRKKLKINSTKNLSNFLITF